MAADVAAPATVTPPLSASRSESKKGLSAMEVRVGYVRVKTRWRQRCGSGQRDPTEQGRPEREL